MLLVRGAAGAGGFSGRAFEEDAEIFGVFDSRLSRDGFDGEIGFGQKLLCFFHSAADDFLMGGAAKEADESAFECAARERDFAEDVFDGDRFASVIPDEADGGGDVGVGDGE